MYANKIKPIRKDGHLLLVTLLLANMIVNETLPVISAPVLGGGPQSVVVSTILIVMCVFPSSFGIFLHTFWDGILDFADLMTCSRGTRRALGTLIACLAT